jgi:RsiW-degrading membrane proteinase PrsW (M82 family)
MTQPPIIPPVMTYSRTVGVRAPALAKPIKHRNLALYWCLFGLAILIMGFCALLSFGADMLETGPLAIVALIAALLPVPIYVGLFLWLDRFEPEPLHLLAAAFCWGAGIAGLFACFLNTLVNLGLGQVVQGDMADQLTASLSAPLMEETLKGLAVAILFFWRRAEFDGVIDGIIYAGMTALGFAMIENVAYYGHGMSGGAAQFGATFLIRGIMSPYAHVLFTSMTGIGFGLARQSRNMGIKIIAPVVGWFLAMTLHFLWNTIPIFGMGIMLIAYIVFWIPMFLGLFAVILYSLHRESKLIRMHLTPAMPGTLILVQDAHAASRLMPRLVGNVPILFTGGWDAWKKLRRYQRAASALAFYRQRLVAGRVLENPELEQLYIAEIVACRSVK